MTAEVCYGPMAVLNLHTQKLRAQVCPLGSETKQQQNFQQSCYFRLVPRTRWPKGRDFGHLYVPLEQVMVKNTNLKTQEEIQAAGHGSLK